MLIHKLQCAVFKLDWEDPKADGNHTNDNTTSKRQNNYRRQNNQNSNGTRSMQKRFNTQRARNLDQSGPVHVGSLFVLVRSGLDQVE